MNQKQLKSLLMSSLTLVIFVLLPLISLIQITVTFNDFSELNKIKNISTISLLISAGIGLGLTILRFFISRIQEPSIKQAWLNIIYNSLIFVLLISIFLIGEFDISIEETGLNFNLNGVIFLLVFAWIPVLLKPVYDLYCFSKVRTSTYLEQGQQRIHDLLYVDCPKCKYTCRKEWKRCPICNTLLRK